MHLQTSDSNSGSSLRPSEWIFSSGNFRGVGRWRGSGVDGKGQYGMTEEARSWKNSSAIPKKSPLDTNFRLLLEDVAHHLSNTFYIQPTEVSHSDVQYSNSIQRSLIKPFISLLGPYAKLWATCSSIASLKITTNSTVP